MWPQLVVLFHLIGRAQIFRSKRAGRNQRIRLCRHRLFLCAVGFIGAAMAGQQTMAGHLLWQRVARIYGFMACKPDCSPPLLALALLPSFSSNRSPLLAVGWTLSFFPVYFYFIDVLILCTGVRLRRSPSVRHAAESFFSHAKAIEDEVLVSRVIRADSV